MTSLGRQTSGLPRLSLVRASPYSIAISEADGHGAGGHSRPVHRPPAEGLRSRPWIVHLFPRRCVFEPSGASTAPPPTRDRQERQPCEASTSATSQSREPVRAGAKASIRRATASAAIGMSVWPLRMSVRPLPARQPRRVLIVLHLRNGVSQIALPASMTALGPGRLPRLDERVLLGDGTTTTPGPDDLADQSRHVKNRILSVYDNRPIRPEKTEQGPFVFEADQLVGNGAAGKSLLKIKYSRSHFPL